MLQPNKPSEGGDDTSDAQQKNTTKQVDSQDMSILEDEGGEAQQPAS